MSGERRYRDHEVREIFDLAVLHEAGQARSIPAAGGLTAAELREIGRDVGLAPALLDRAIAEFEERGHALARVTWLGMPTGVGRVTPLPRAVTDPEWERIVAELRAAFGVKGEVSAHGGLRDWSADNLHAFIEPTETGHRLRLTDSAERAAAAGVVVGLLLLAFAALVALILLGKENPGSRVFVPLLTAIAGGGLIAAGVLTLPAWAARRERQMESVAARVRALLGGAPSSED